MVNGLEYKNFTIDPIIEGSDGSWYTFAGFDISELKKRWGIHNHRVTYTLDTPTILVTSSTISENPAHDEISDETFTKRLIQNKFEPEKIEQFVREKINEASQKNTIDEVYEYLKKYFVIEDE